MRSLLAFAGFLLTTWSSLAQVPLPSPIPSHPRLIVSNADWARLREQIKTDPFSKDLFATLQARAQTILPQPPAQRILEGRRMLGTSRRVLERVTLLATLANITGETGYADRAITEMLAAVRFSDWHPQHYLDTAEMSLAIAIGYDWLYDRLTPQDRTEIATALLEKGINTSLDPKSPYCQWIRATNNWNQVCHAGISAAAIALADLHPKIAATVLNRAIQDVPLAGHAYAPDGVYPEGPMYWSYGTSFHVLLVAALDRFYGQAHGLDTLPGFAQSPLFIMEVTGPTGGYFDFSDAHENREFGIPLFWFARNQHNAAWTAFDIRHRDQLLAHYPQGQDVYRLLPFALIWQDPALSTPPPASFPLQWLGHGANPVAFHRSAWNDPQAAYVALKGGSPSLSHAHMDAGSFVLEADGIRWALDLGMENYNRIEQMGINLWNGAQDGTRWQLFRLGPESHNILRFNNAPQNVKAQATFIRFQNGGAQGASVLDLSPLYADQAASVRRGIRLLPSRAVLFQDEWSAKEQPVNVAWQFMTRAQPVVNKEGSVELRQNGKSLALRILEPAGAQIEIKPAKELQKPFDADNPGVSRISIQTHTEAQASGTLRILAIPGSCQPAPEAPPAEALLSWPGKL